MRHDHCGEQRPSTGIMSCHTMPRQETLKLAQKRWFRGMAYLDFCKIRHIDFGVACSPKGQGATGCTHMVL